METAQIVVAGHVCLDVIPAFGERSGGAESIFAPGGLVGVGPALTTTGGPVSNTGLALHRLGVPTKLMGKVGDDLFGHQIIDLLREADPALAAGMIVDPAAVTSYSLVISPPGVDRFFYHCPGANDTFGANDVDLEALAEARIFHFGYPPLMQRMYADNGAELASLMQRVHDLGLTTSLDMATVDPESPAGQANWTAILERTLPHVDLYLPSFDETLFMLDRDRFDDLVAQSTGNLAAEANAALLGELAGCLLDMGAALVGLKLGDQGLYVRTTADPDRIAAMGRAAPSDPAAWVGREWLAPCFKTEVVGTTGAGDCTIAGFLAALLEGFSLPDTMTSAVAVGAFNVESADAVSGIRPWANVQARIAAGWERLAVSIDLPGWTWIPDPGLYTPSG
jgi:sugar/nucleoside kinase (ribokinase family)